MHAVYMIELDDRHRQALELLAHDRKGCKQAMLLAYGVSGDILDALVLHGMATAQTEPSPGQPGQNRGLGEDHKRGIARDRQMICPAGGR
jgi:hypothetical protein